MPDAPAASAAASRTTSPTTSATASRRDLLKAACGAVAIGSTLALQPHAFAGLFAGAFAAGSDALGVGLIGCGGRGLGAVKDAVRAAEGVEIRALGDVFEDQLAKARQNLESEEDEAIRAAAKLADDSCFAGFDAYRRVIERDGVDYVLIACPPYFHPAFAEAAVDAGKHVFCEKPGAIDAPGVRRLIATGEKAKQQNTAFLAGTQRRHQLSYLDTIGRIHAGAIGRPLYGEAFWNNREWIVVPREEGWSDVEWQIRNWRQNRWLSGDAPGIILIHYLDTIGWALDAQPVSAYGTGGRILRTDPALYGNIYDHFEANFTYADGRRVHAMCRNLPGDAKHSEYVLGTDGSAELGTEIRGTSETYNFRDAYRAEHGAEADEPSPYVLEHRDLIASVRAGRPINEAHQLAEASLASVMMREAAYTGRVVTREFLLKESKRILGPEAPPEELSFGDHPVDPVARPGEYELL